jgi:undecaprenyl pyrophosphate synthase
MGLKIIDKLQQFAQKNANAMDRALNLMAVDIERLSKEQVPHDKGHLKVSGRHEKKGFLNWQVVYNKVYALYQHEGKRQDGSHVVRRYSKPGKKKHYLKDPGMQISKRAVDYFKREARFV